MKNIFSAFALRRALMLICACIIAGASPLACAKKHFSITVTINAHQTGAVIPIDVETAVSSAEQQQGFMHRQHIPDGTGMIFIYKQDNRLRFWMKDTPHPLSIAFIDSTGRIREIYDMQPFSLAVIASAHSVRYALEVPQGYFERTGITAGDTVTEESLVLLKQLVK